jgi:aspartate/methionine/tyrosine aminotransferase
MTDSLPTGFQPPPYPYDRLDEIIALANDHDGGAVDLSIGTPCDPSPPAVLAALSAGDTARGYPPSIGTTAFRTAAAEWIERRLGAPVDPATELAAEQALRAAGLDPSARGETLTVHEFARLAELRPS